MLGCKEMWWKVFVMFREYKCVFYNWIMNNGIKDKMDIRMDAA